MRIIRFQSTSLPSSSRWARHPQQQPIPVNLPQAKEIIDLLSVLEEKTKGNLTSEEQTVLRDMLYALRMKYVTLASPK